MKKKAPVKKAPPKKVKIKPPKPPCKKVDREKIPNRDYGPTRASYPQKLFGLIRSTKDGQAIVAQVKAPTRSEAIGLFQKHSSWSLLLSDRIQVERAEQVVELGGIDLPYVQAMKPGEIRES